MDKSRYITKAEAKRLLAAINDPVAKEVAKRMLKYGERAGAALANLRTVSVHDCGHCGRRFTALLTAKFCSNSCRQRNKRLKALEARYTRKKA